MFSLTRESNIVRIDAFIIFNFLLLCIFTGLEPSFYLAALVTPANLVNHACKLFYLLHVPNQRYALYRLF